jgi:hypothetical protein
MTTPSKTVRRSIAILNLPQSKVPMLINFAQQVLKSITGNPTFPTPTPTVADLTQAITDLQNAENAALARTKGATATRNEKRTALIMKLEQLKAYIQSVADANVDNSGSIIQSAGLTVRKVTTHKPRVFEAVAGATLGTVKITTVSAGPRASYEWQSSTDGGKTWVDMAPTLQAKTSMAGLAEGTTVLIRYRTVTKTGAADWSTPTTYTVK